MSQAADIAALFGNDGQEFVTADGQDFGDLCIRRGAEVDHDPRSPDTIRYTFDDGSALTEAGDGWDIGFAGCFCWQSCPHEGCKHE